MVDALGRYFAPAIEPRSVLPRPVPALDEDSVSANRLGITMDKVRYHEAVTGAEWDELTSFLAASPKHTPLPLATWGSLAERLLSELIIADGLPWLLRFEAFNRLLAHPQGQAAAVDACARLGNDRTNQVFIETWCALDSSTHPDAGRYVLAQLDDRINDRAFYGALLACVRKSQGGHFAPSDAQRLAARVYELLADDGISGSLQRLAGQVLGNLRRHPASRDVVDRPAFQRFAHLFDPTRLAEPRIAQLIVHRIEASVRVNHLQELPNERDELLPLLLNEALCNPVSDVRLYTAMLLRASPYRATIADALVQELRQPAVRRDAALLLSVVGALRVVGTRQHAPVVQRFVVAPGIPPGLRETAAFSVGHLDAVATEPFWPQAIAYHLGQWAKQHDEHHAAVLTGLVYGLGVAGDQVLLQRIRQADAPDAVRQAAAWWLNLPGYVRTSAQQ